MNRLQLSFLFLLLLFSSLFARRSKEVHLTGTPSKKISGYVDTLHYGLVDGKVMLKQGKEAVISGSMHATFDAIERYEFVSEDTVYFTLEEELDSMTRSFMGEEESEVEVSPIVGIKVKKFRTEEGWEKSADVELTFEQKYAMVARDINTTPQNSVVSYPMGKIKIGDSWESPMGEVFSSFSKTKSRDSLMTWTLKEIKKYNRHKCAVIESVIEMQRVDLEDGSTMIMKLDVTIFYALEYFLEVGLKATGTMEVSQSQGSGGMEYSAGVELDISREIF